MSSMPPAASAPRARIIVTDVESIPGQRIGEHHGLVAGNTFRANHVGRDIMASLKNVGGGELKGYTELLSEARAVATERMLAQAAALGANALVNVRCSTSSVAQGASEMGPRQDISVRATGVALRLGTWFRAPAIASGSATRSRPEPQPSSQAMGRSRRDSQAPGAPAWIRSCQAEFRSAGSLPRPGPPRTAGARAGSASSGASPTAASGRRCRAPSGGGPGCCRRGRRRARPGRAGAARRRCRGRRGRGTSRSRGPRRRARRR